MVYKQYPAAGKEQWMLLLKKEDIMLQEFF